MPTRFRAAVAALPLGLWVVSNRAIEEVRQLIVG